MISAKDTEQIKQPRILLIRIDHLGDAILSTPMLEALCKHYPNAEITCIVSERTLPLFENDPRIAALVSFELRSASKSEKRSLANWVRAQRFDIAISLSEKFWPAVWAGYSGAALRIGFDAGWYLPLHALWRRAAYNRRVFTQSNPTVPSPKHEVERYMDLLRPLGIDDRPGKLTLPLKSEDAVWAQELVNTWGIRPDQKPVGFHFSALWGNEGWPETIQVEIIRAILRQLPNLVVVGTAGPGERDLLLRLQDDLPKERFHLAQDMTLSQWGHLAGRFHAYVSFETGSAHVGAAAGTPVLMVFHHKEFSHRSTRWTPWGVPNRVMQRPTYSDATGREFVEKLAENALELSRSHGEV